MFLYIHYLFQDGGTFTISNGGVFGSLFGTPIINPPQSAILGMHGSFERPVVRNGQVSVSSERVFENLFTYFWETFRYSGFLVS